MKTRIMDFINDGIDEVRNINTRDLDKSLYLIIALMVIFAGIYTGGRLIGKAAAKYHIENNTSR